MNQVSLNKGLMIQFTIENEGKTKKFQCKHCMILFISSVTLERHQIVHRFKRPYFCDICGKQYTYSGLKRHKVTHMENTASCDICGQYFPNNSALNIHVKIAHTKIRKKCGICKLEVYNLEWHMKTHSERDRLKCDVCGNDFSSKGNLEVHKKLKHSTTSKILLYLILSFITNAASIRGYPFQRINTIDISISSF